MVAGQFVAFLDTRGGIGRCDAAAVPAFVATMAGYQFKTVEQKLCAVRSFLRFAAADGLCDAAVLDAVPAVKSRTQTRIRSVWDPAEVMKMLNAVDRGNPCGKRDYAIILLITRLGLRGIDVKRLEFGDFDWPGNRLSAMQVNVPHIYTDQELAALFTQTDRRRYCAEVPLRHLVMPVLFRTIYACGLRCSEARLLRVDDVDIHTGVLQILDAKGGKDRQVPVSEALRNRLADYHTRIAGQPSRREWFFPGAAGQPLTLGNVYHNFRRFLWQAGISHASPTVTDEILTELLPAVPHRATPESSNAKCLSTRSNTPTTAEPRSSAVSSPSAALK